MLKAFPLLTAALVASTASGAAGPSPSKATLTLEIQHLWRSQKIAIPTPALPRGDGDPSLLLTRLAYLVSEPSVQKKSDAQWLTRPDWFAYVDAAGREGTAILELAGLPRGKYDALRFHADSGR